jgi:hypothetical protein
MGESTRYQYKHIAWQVPTVQYAVVAPKDKHILLGRVVVNTGGRFRLSIYNGNKAESQALVAVIDNPSGGQTFTYDCVLDQGIAAIVEGERDAKSNPYSVTILYLEV